MTKKSYLSPCSEQIALEEMKTIMQASPSVGSGEQMDDNVGGWGDDFWD